jgi:hypothetical protein
MGVRYRHYVCERWIAEGAHIEEVLQNLRAANFDPEFFREYEPEVIRLYNQEYSGNLRLRRRKGLTGLIFGRRWDGRVAVGKDS